jgi:AcrR family transcriptional regulator
MTTRAYTKRARAEAEDRTRAALLDAAEGAFFSVGWSASSLEAISRQAGVSKPTLLRHFGSKHGLVEAAFRRAQGRIRAERFATPPGDLEAAIDNLLDHYEKDGDQAIRVGAMTAEAGIDVGLEARRLHYAWVDHAFGPSIDAMPAAERPQVRAALIAACDVQTWAILARDLTFDRPMVRATLLLTIRRLLKEDA